MAMDKTLQTIGFLDLVGADVDGTFRDSPHQSALALAWMPTLSSQPSDTARVARPSELLHVAPA